ncbi:hypothetical protein DL98DRAFT_509655 [Cadophora sp. DSE1049]|nr:hypothetical protein DL98DRAFT_509655 [Cadophora sp. DSE1049]
MCTARHATKRHLHRHVNACHTHVESYYCPVSTCKRSIENKRKMPFHRQDNCLKHVRKSHRSMDPKLQVCVVDETKSFALGSSI